MATRYNTWGYHINSWEVIVVATRYNTWEYLLTRGNVICRGYEILISENIILTRGNVICRGYEILISENIILNTWEYHINSWERDMSWLLDIN